MTVIVGSCHGKVCSTQWRVMSVQRWLCPARCVTAWWDISVCATRRKWEMRMSVEGKMRWNNNQQCWTEVADRNKRCPCGFFLWKSMWAKDASDPMDERKESEKSNCRKSLWRSSEEKGEMYENFGSHADCENPQLILAGWIFFMLPWWYCFGGHVTESEAVVWES